MFDTDTGELVKLGYGPPGTIKIPEIIKTHLLALMLNQIAQGTESRS